MDTCCFSSWATLCPVALSSFDFTSRAALVSHAPTCHNCLEYVHRYKNKNRVRRVCNHTDQSLPTAATTSTSSYNKRLNGFSLVEWCWITWIKVAFMFMVTYPSLVSGTPVEIFTVSVDRCRCSLFWRFGAQSFQSKIDSKVVFKFTRYFGIVVLLLTWSFGQTLIG